MFFSVSNADKKRNPIFLVSRCQFDIFRFSRFSISFLLQVCIVERLQSNTCASSLKMKIKKAKVFKFGLLFSHLALSNFLFYVTLVSSKHNSL